MPNFTFMAKVFFTFFIALCCISLGMAQQRTCGNTLQAALQHNHPHPAITPQSVDNARKFAESYLSKNIALVDSPLIRIPVVVHIIHNGELLGIGANISDQQVFNQIQILNNDFRRLPGTNGFNTRPEGVDTKIQFELAAFAPDNSPTTGINRVNGGRTGWTLNENNALKALSRWPSTEYLNLWVCNLTDYLGYAAWPNSSLPGLGFPDQGPNNDGIVIAHPHFGLTGSAGGNYNLGRTLTHELGHFLGLIHVWGDGDCSLDDFCTDTPLQSGPVFGCPSVSNTCAVAASPRDPVENYLNFTDDACMNTFTRCQALRMRHVLLNSVRRSTLVNNNKLTTSTRHRLSSKLIQVAPNPVKAGGKLSLSQTIYTFTYQLIDLQGRVVVNSHSVENTAVTVPAHLLPGVYLLKVQSNQGLQHAKLLVQ